ncbi:hypothetical protein GCM10009570_06350 [Dietzia natronolimnaea]
MSTTINPVRHIAEVAVNSASVTPVPPPGSTAPGRSNNAVPTAIAAAKLIATTRTGLNTTHPDNRRTPDGHTRLSPPVTTTDCRPTIPDGGL